MIGADSDTTGHANHMNRHISLLVLAGFAATPAFGFELPPHKPGLWEMSVAQGGGNAPAFAMQRCTDASTDQFITALAGGLASEACFKHDVRTVGDKIVMDSTCKTGSVTSVAHAEITGSFERAYTMTVSARQQGAAAGSPPAGERRMTVDAKWLGPCEAGQKPGDLILPGGFKMNVRNIKGIMGLLGGMQ
jgi:hypothetical protein